MAPTNGDENQALSLDQIVRDVARQLHGLRDNPLPEAKDPVMQFSGCEIELAVKATAEAGGGIKFYVFSAEAKAGTEQSSKIKLTFGSIGRTVAFLAGTPGDAGVHTRQ